MDVSAASNQQTSNSSSTQKPAVAKDKLDYDSFLTLLVAQLKNQDPTQPQDSAQYIAQLATFSNVEQSIKSNAKLDQLITLSALSQANDVIGHTVTSEDGSITGKVASLKVTSDGPVAVLDNGAELPIVAGVTIS
jgi:flagellar basal-body rod modification protein FlgD